jgi:hypothetical protein
VAIKRKRVCHKAGLPESYQNLFESNPRVPTSRQQANCGSDKLLGQSNPPHQVLVAWIGTQAVEHRPHFGECQIMFAPLVGFLQP